MEAPARAATVDELPSFWPSRRPAGSLPGSEAKDHARSPRPRSARPRGRSAADPARRAPAGAATGIEATGPVARYEVALKDESEQSSAPRWQRQLSLSEVDRPHVQSLADRAAAYTAAVKTDGCLPLLSSEVPMKPTSRASFARAPAPAEGGAAQAAKFIAPVTPKGPRPLVAPRRNIVRGENSPGKPGSTDRSHAEYRPSMHFINILTSSSTTLKDYLDAISFEVCYSLSCDECIVFIIDDIREEMWCLTSREGDGDFGRQTWEGSIAGTVAREGAPVLRNEPRSPGSLAGRKAVACVAVKHVLDHDRIIGAIEVANTRDHAPFDDQDIKVLEDIARLVCDSFYRHRWQALESLLSRGDSEALALLYTTTGSQVQDSAAMTPSTSSRTRYSSRPITPAVLEDLQGLEELEEDSEPPVPSGGELLSFLELSVEEDLSLAFVQMRSLDFNALSWSAEDLVRLVEPALQHAQCVQRCNVRRECLQNWAQAARRLYHDNPFHNWFHGFSVFQMCYFMMNTSSMAQRVTTLEVFALLIAALCHDLDHPGFTNSFLVDSESVLALRHNDMSVLENHHANLACELLRREATAIGAGLSAESQKTLRKLIIKTILDTDMTHHAEMCQKLQASIGGEVQGQPLLSCAIHCADLSAQVLPWKVASLWEERISQEFVRQAHEETVAGRTPMPFMSFKFEDIKQRSKLQRDFLDFVLVPLWDPVTQIFPELRLCYRNLIKNRGFYQNRWSTGEEPGPDHNRARRRSAY